MGCITVLRSSDGRPQCKKFELEDDQIKPVQQPWAFFFDVEQREIKDLKQLSSLLTDLEKQPNALVIRGRPNEGINPHGVRRTSAGVEVSFRSQKCRWLCVDIDELEPPNELPHFNDDPILVAEYTVSQLPQEFQGIDFHWQFSGSMGIKSGIRIHLWFWLDRPISDQEARAWLVNSAVNVDLRLYHQIQAHFTASPKRLRGFGCMIRRRYQIKDDVQKEPNSCRELS